MVNVGVCQHKCLTESSKAITSLLKTDIYVVIPTMSYIMIRNVPKL